jgi:hypothetical protein
MKATQQRFQETIDHHRATILIANDHIEVLQMSGTDCVNDHVRTSSAADDLSMLVNPAAISATQIEG